MWLANAVDLPISAASSVMDSDRLEISLNADTSDLVKVSLSNVCFNVFHNTKILYMYYTFMQHE
jgi:hypothetical protein